MALILLAAVPIPATAATAPATETETFARRWEIHATFSVIRFQELVIRDSTLTVPYSDDLEGIPVTFFTLSTPAKGAGPWRVAFQLGVGYAATQTDAWLEGDLGRRRDQIMLRSLPVLLSVRADYEVPGIRFMMPSLSLGLGGWWVWERSRASGLDRWAWFPAFRFQPSLTFFQAGQLEDWFGGFTFGLGYEATALSRHDFRAWSFDLTVNFNL